MGGWCEDMHIMKKAIALLTFLSWLNVTDGKCPGNPCSKIMCEKVPDARCVANGCIANFYYPNGEIINACSNAEWNVLKYGETFIDKCYYSKQDNVHWYNRIGGEQETLPDDRVHCEEYNSNGPFCRKQVVRINQLQLGDSGMYQCRHSGESKQVVKTVYLDVQKDISHSESVDAKITWGFRCTTADTPSSLAININTTSMDVTYNVFQGVSSFNGVMEQKYRDAYVHTRLIARSNETISNSIRCYIERVFESRVEIGNSDDDGQDTKYTTTEHPKKTDEDESQDPSGHQHSSLSHTKWIAVAILVGVVVLIVILVSFVAYYVKGKKESHVYKMTERENPDNTNHTNQITGGGDNVTRNVTSEMNKKGPNNGLTS